MSISDLVYNASAYEAVGNAERARITFEVAHEMFNIRRLEDMMEA